MSLPEHKNPRPERTASAPYNFVPLPETVVTAVDDANDLPDHDTYANEGYPHTGYFDVTLTTKSPLYVRCPFTWQQFDLDEQEKDKNGQPIGPQTRYENRIKNTPDFFYTRDRNQPVIPGSSLRGMLRAVLEIVSYGKVDRVTEKRLFYRTVDTKSSVGIDYVGRMSDPKADGSKKNGFRMLVEGGFMRNGLLQIEKCIVARVELHDVAGAFGVQGTNEFESKTNLYTNLGPNGKPKWSYQHKRVYVMTDATELDHKHGGRYLRYLRVKSISITATGSPGEQEGVLVMTGPMQNQRMAFVFIPVTLPDMIGVPNDLREEDPNKRLLERFHDDDQTTAWQEGAFPKGSPTGATRARDGWLRDDEPIFFLREKGQLIFFGRAQLFRLPYTQRPVDLVPPELRRVEDVDYAEALFGHAKGDKVKGRQGEKARAYASRVCVADATTTQADVWLSVNPITPKILATPKPTAFQHYLVQQNDSRSTLNHYGSLSPEKTVLRGHKLYWHQSNRGRQEIEEYPNPQPTSTQYTRFNPVKDGVTFNFRVYFENLSDAELGALCWTLHPPGNENDNQEYCHSLGMGKPLGMGAVKLDATLYLTNRKTRYDSLFDGDNWQIGTSGPGEKLSERKLLQNRVELFEKNILAAVKPDKPCTHLFELKRIAMLLKMMEWRGYPPQPGLAYLPDLGRPNTRYMKIQANEYRDRLVLPSPSQFGDLTGDAIPTATTPVAATAANSPATAAAAKSVGANVDFVTAQIKGLRGKGEVSRMPQIVRQIAVIANYEARIECAKRLEQWLRREKLWVQEPHASADWRKQLDDLLKGDK